MAAVSFRVARSAGFTGTIQSQFSPALGRSLNPQLADLGRLLWFDKSGGLHDDNTCGGCHSPSRAFGDTQSIAIGIQNNNVVGPNRKGTRNQRRTPFASNTPFYPNMMWNGRFAAISGDPFDNSLGFQFPFPEGATRFAPNDPIVTHLSIAQAHMPPTELVEVAGFTCTAGTIAAELDQFDDGKGACLPPADATGTRNDPIRAIVLQRLNGTPAYRQLFGALFPSVAAGRAIDFSMFARAIAEFAQRCFALRLAAICVNAIYAVIAGFENVRNTLSSATRAGKDEHAFEWLPLLFQKCQQESRL